MVQAAAGVVPATAPAIILGVWSAMPKDNEAEFAYVANSAAPLGSANTAAGIIATRQHRQHESGHLRTCPNSAAIAGCGPPPSIKDQHPWRLAARIGGIYAARGWLPSSVMDSANDSTRNRIAFPVPCLTINSRRMTRRRTTRPCRGVR